MSFAPSDFQVLNRGALGKYKYTELAVDVTVAAVDVVVPQMTHIWTPFDPDGYTENGRLIVILAGAAYCDTPGQGRIGVSIGGAFRGWSGLGNNTASRAGSACIPTVGPPMVVYGGSSGTIAVEAHVGRVNAPGPAVLSIPALSNPIAVQLKMLSIFVKELGL